MKDNMINEAVQILEYNLQQVWNERNPRIRLKTIEKIYAANATLYHVESKVTGHEEINNSVTAILKNLPPDFEFTLLKPIIINNGLGRAIWGAGPKGQAPISNGMDIAH